MKRIYFIVKTIFRLTCAAGLIFILSLSASADEAVKPPESLAQIIEEGLIHNKEIQSLESQLDGLRQEVDIAGSLNDPMIGFALANLPVDTFRFDQEPMTQKQISISQKIPWFGKLSLQSKKAAAKTIRQEALIAAKKLSLTRQISDAYYGLGFVSSSEDINRQLQEMVTQLLKVSETRYAAGKGIQKDIFQGQVELSLLLDEQIALNKNRLILGDRINELLNLDRYLPIDPPANLPYPALNLDVTDLQNLALEKNPDLNIRRAEISIAETDIELAEKAYKPDMEFKLSYGQRDDGQKGEDRADFLSASVAMNIPLWKKNRQDKELASAHDRHEAAIQRYQQVEKALPHKIDAVVNDIRHMQKNYLLYKDALIIQATQWAQSSLTSYEVGKLDFNAMIDAQLRLLRLELKAEQYLFDIYKKKAELEEIIGCPIPEKNDAAHS